MPEIIGAELQIDRLISADPANGVIAALDSSGAAVNLIAYGQGTGDVTYSAPTGNTTNTRRHLFDRPIVMSADILFTDALYDIGKSGATRPRDGFFSRDVKVGNTLTIKDAYSTSATASTLAPGSFLDLTTNVTSGAGYQGILTVYCSDSANGGNRTQSIYAVMTRGTGQFTATLLGTVNGGTNPWPFTLTTPSNGVLRVTPTTAVGTSEVRMSWFGGAGA